MHINDNKAEEDTNCTKKLVCAVAKGKKFMIPVVMDPEALDSRKWATTVASYHLIAKAYIVFSSEEKRKIVHSKRYFALAAKKSMEKKKKGIEAIKFRVAHLEV